MTEHITLQLGAQPWLPSESVRLVRELNYYDMPTEGILKTKNRFPASRFFFACIDGAASEYSLWVYAPISRSEARRLARLQTHDLRLFEAKLLVNRPLVIAMAHETKGIAHGGAEVTVSEKLTTDEPKLAQEAWQTVNAGIKAEAGAIQRMAFC